MPGKALHRLQRKPTLRASVAIFLLCTLPMAYVRIVLFGEQVVALNWGLPLLICLVYPSRRLLWAMALAFIALSGIKAFYFLPDTSMTPLQEAIEWLWQVVNILVLAGAVDLVMRFVDRLHDRHAQLESAHDELVAREEEISRQNEELQTQSEEMAQQNEELERQAEELQQQAEELQAQGEELQGANQELQQRQFLLQTMLHSVQSGDSDRELLDRICRSLIDLFRGTATAAAVLEKEGEDLVLRAHAGAFTFPAERWPHEHTFAAIVMGEDRTGYIADLTQRPDLVVPRPESFRSVLATPLRLRGKPAGAVKVYSETPHEWTKEQFQIIEWVSAQCTLILEARLLHRELKSTNVNLDRVVMERTLELRDLVNELEHFSYTITHDMRAPLRAMSGYAELLAEDAAKWLDPESRDYVRRINSAAERMDRLITDALSYSRAVRQHLELTPLDATVLLREIIESYPAFQAPTAVIEIQPDIPPLMANAAGLTQCFSNLLGNAVKFVSPGVVPRVTIGAERRDGVVRLWFEDNGIGIPREMQSRLFVMFQRLSKQYDGTGIGLALVKKVAERMGGTVGVDSEPGRGSRFWIELKAAE